jgi:hypothetical protein
MVYRTKDGLALNTESAPFIFGLGALNQNANYLALRSSEDAVIYQLSLETAMKIIKRDSLWQPLSLMMAYVASRLFTHCTRLSQPDAYGVIRHLLLELALEPETFRRQQSAVCYIQNRSHLSRSCISAILSALRQGSWIDISQGKLISIKVLPEKF